MPISSGALGTVTSYYRTTQQVHQHGGEHSGRRQHSVSTVNTVSTSVRKSNDVNADSCYQDPTWRHKHGRKHLSGHRRHRLNRHGCAVCCCGLLVLLLLAGLGVALYYGITAAINEVNRIRSPDLTPGGVASDRFFLVQGQGPCQHRGWTSQDGSLPSCDLSTHVYIEVTPPSEASCVKIPFLLVLTCITTQFLVIREQCK